MLEDELLGRCVKIFQVFPSLGEPLENGPGGLNDFFSQLEQLGGALDSDVAEQLKQELKLLNIMKAKKGRKV